MQGGIAFKGRMTVKKHSVFLPMPLEGFEQSFRTNVPYLNLKTPIRYFADESFTGRLKNGRFTLSYLQLYNHGLSTVLSGKAVKYEGGILLTCHYRKIVYLYVICSFMIAVAFLSEGVGFYAVIQSQANAAILLPPIPFLAVTFLFMLVKSEGAEKRLYDKLDSICCGLLKASWEAENKNGQKEKL